MDKLQEIIFSKHGAFIFIALSFLFLLFAFFQKNNNFFDVKKIIKGHIKIFNGAIFPMVTFFLVPALLSFGITLIKVVSSDILNCISLIVTIFLSFLFAVMGIIVSAKNNSSDEKKKLIDETVNTILFESVDSICLLVFVFTVIFVDSYENNVYMFLASFFIYYLFFVLILNSLIVIKRVSKI